MDQTPAQPVEQPAELSASISPPKSPFKKLLIISLIGAFILILLAGLLVLFAGKGNRQAGVPIPTIRPTATPFPPPTIPLVTQPTPLATISAYISPIKIGRLIFIKEGDIYQSDLSSFSLLIKNTTAAADKLSWSPKGNLLAWRPKSTTATPSAVTVYDREENASFTLVPKKEEAEVIDYAFSPDEKQIALLSHDESYNISLFSLSPGFEAVTLVEQTSEIKQILWLKDKRIIFAGSDGISSLNVASLSAKLMLPKQNVLQMKLSPDESKLLYSVGSKEKSDLYLVNSDGSSNQLLSAAPAKIDMGKTDLPPSILAKGFIPNALFFPSGDNLLVGYHYLTNLPLVGIYDLKNNSFTAVSPFYLGSDDVMIDEYRLLGARVVTTASKTPFWQISLFTLENNSNLGVIRAIPEAYSPSFFAAGL